MPFLGFLAVGRFIFYAGKALWRTPEFRGMLWITLMVIAIGAWTYRSIEPEQFTSWTDAIYFTVITLTTIGYGDFSPTLPLTRWFTIFYIFVGLGIIAAFISIIGETVIRDMRERREAREDANR